MPGYQGWQWAVVVAAHPGADHATISEVVLVPGPTALLAPKWVPWQERVQPGDLGPGDLLAPPSDDPRLVPGFTATGDPEIDEVAVELGLGRRQVLSELGSRRRRATLARRRVRAGLGDGPVHPPGVPRLRVLSAAAGVAGHDVRGVRQRDVRRRTRRRQPNTVAAHTRTRPAPAGTGSPLYDPYDDGVLDVVEPPPPSDDEPPPPDVVEPPPPSDDEQPAPSTSDDRRCRATRPISR